VERAAGCGVAQVFDTHHVALLVAAGASAVVLIPRRAVRGIAGGWREEKDARGDYAAC